MINRRILIGSAFAIVLRAPTLKAQQTEKVRRIVFFSAAAGPNPLADAFRQGLRELGYVEGRNIVIDYQWMAQRQAQYQEVAREISTQPVDVIVTAGHPPAVAAKRATSQVPIVALAVVDPVGAGFVASLSRPGANLTGLSLEVTPETNVKMLQLLREAIPGAARLGVLWNSANPGSELYLDLVRKAAHPLKVALEARDVRQPDDIALAFRSLKGNVDGLVIFSEPLLWTYRRLVVDQARTAGLPTIFGYRDAAEMGGLMSYGPDLVELFRQGARYVDKIFKGTPPAELPVEQPTKFELVINLNTAKDLGVTIPTSLLLRADQTIE